MGTFLGQYIKTVNFEAITKIESVSNFKFFYLNE